jgi:uncharacterized protein (TIGR02246 family)
MTIDHEALLRTYFGNVNARNAPALAAMYASHGTLTLANGVRVSGRESIREFFETLFAQSPPGPQLVRVIGAGLACAAELLVTLADGKRQAVADFFRLDEQGLIVDLTIYLAEVVA